MSTTDLDFTDGTKVSERSRTESVLPQADDAVGKKKEIREKQNSEVVNGRNQRI